MKKYLIILLLVLLTSPLYAQDQLAWMGAIGAAGGVSAAAGQAAAYFGWVDASGDCNTGALSYGDLTDNTMGNKDVTFACPGTGTRTVEKLQAYMKSNGGAAGNCRLALYNTSSELIGQGSSEVSVSSTTVSWIGHTGLSINCTGGTNYRILLSCDNGDPLIAYTGGFTEGDTAYTVVDRTDGFPATQTLDSGHTIHICIRGYVTAIP